MIFYTINEEIFALNVGRGYTSRIPPKFFLFSPRANSSLSSSNFCINSGSHGSVSFRNSLPCRNNICG